MQSTLVLNASFEPLRIVSVTKAMTYLAKNQVTAVDNSPQLYVSERLTIPIPYVVAWNRMVQSNRNTIVGFSRRGVFARDGFKCVYCGESATTLDHVHPQSLGGNTSYENCVAACFPCNQKKGDKTLEYLGWKLAVQPKAPSRYLSVLHKFNPSEELLRVWEPHIEPWTGSKLIRV